MIFTIIGARLLLKREMLKHLPFWHIHRKPQNAHFTYACKAANSANTKNWEICFYFVTYILIL